LEGKIGAKLKTSTPTCFPLSNCQPPKCFNQDHLGGQQGTTWNGSTRTAWVGDMELREMVLPEPPG